ncbi:MAG: hypothetical protein R3D27_13825 [Hyphomicrobiaceae bacterium]
MQNISRAALAVVVAGSVVGCASSGPTGREALTGSIAAGKSRLVLYRTSPLGFAIQPSYQVNGKAVAASQPNGFFVCELPPGRHEVSIANLNPSLTGGSDKVAVDLAPGGTSYVKAEPQIGLVVGAITLTAVTEGQGRIDTADLHRIEGACGA